MEGEPKKATVKLKNAWQHTVALCAFAAAVISIIGFFGIKPPTATPASKKSETPSTPTPPKKPAGFAAGVAESDRKPGEIGTFHLDGGFDPGEPMISKAPLAASSDSTTVTLLHPNGKEESLQDTKVVLPVETNQSVSVWRKGRQFVRGIRFPDSSPHLTLKGEGMASVDVPTDADGRLQVNVVWPVNKSFITVEFAGPIQLAGLTLDGGLAIGQSEPLEITNVLPSHFSLNVPKPGEVLSEFKGEFRYPAGTDERRYVVVQAFASSDQPVTAWSAEFNHFGPTVVRRTKGGVFDRGFTALKVLYSREPE